MLIKNVCKGLVKKPVVTLICVLLLTAAMLLFQLAAAMTGVTTAPRVEKHLTIAVPAQSLFDKGLAEMVETIRKQVTSVTEYDARVYAQGYSAGLEPYIPSSLRNMSAPVGFGIFVVKCVDATEERRAEILFPYRYTATFEIEQVIALHDAYSEHASAGTVFTVSEMSQQAYEAFFEGGKRYLIWSELTKYFEDSECDFSIGYDDLTVIQKVVEENGKHVLHETASKSGRFFPEWSELNVPYEEFLKTEMGQMWQELILPKAEICYHSVVAVGTDQVESIPAFNLDQVTVIKGETITEEQYKQGEQVCLISEELAELNGLSVGDVIPFSLYPATFCYYSRIVPTYSNTFDAEMGFMDEGEFRVVGIYRNAEPFESFVSPGVHPNTVYLPKNALKGVYLIAGRPAVYEYHQLSYIMNASQEKAFEAEMIQLGYGGLFEYHSGPTIDDIETKMALADAQASLVQDAADKASAVRMLAILPAAIAAFLMMWVTKREIGRFYAIETSGSTLFWHIFLRGLPTCALSVLLSHLIAGAVFPSAVPDVLYRLAEARFADRLIETLAPIPSLTQAVLGGAAVILALAAFFAAVGSKRSYHFEYHERSEG